jgi:hypothetical protein
MLLALAEGQLSPAFSAIVATGSDGGPVRAASRSAPGVDVLRDRLRLALVQAGVDGHDARKARERAHAEMCLHEVAADRAVLAAVGGVAGRAVVVEDRLAAHRIVRAAACGSRRNQCENEGPG